MFAIVVLCYFDTSLLEVNIDCDHPARLKDFFLVLFTLFWYFEPLSWYLLFQGYGCWWLLHQLSLVRLLLGGPLPSGLSLFLGFYSEKLALFPRGPNSLSFSYFDCDGGAVPTFLGAFAFKHRPILFCRLLFFLRLPRSVYF